MLVFELVTQRTIIGNPLRDRRDVWLVFAGLAVFQAARTALFFLDGGWGVFWRENLVARLLALAQDGFLIDFFFILGYPWFHINSQEEKMNLVERAKNILLTPAKEWDVIKGESLTIADMFTKYAMILAAIPAVAGFIGYVVIGMSFGGFGTFRMPIGTALIWAILTYILSLGGVFLLAFIIDALAPTFGCAKDMVAAVKIVVFSYTAAWVAGILSIIPALAHPGQPGQPLFAVPHVHGHAEDQGCPAKDKMVGYFVVTIVAAIVVFMLIGFVVSRVAFGSMAGLAGGMGSF